MNENATYSSKYLYCKIRNHVLSEQHKEKKVIFLSTLKRIKEI